VDARNGTAVPDIAGLADRIRAARATAPSARSILAAITGIDGCGKGYLASRVVASLSDAGHRVAGINVDGWLNLPRVRFSDVDPAEHFYRHALRFDELFDDPHPAAPRPPVGRGRRESRGGDGQRVARRRYEFHDVDVVVLEGIYLLKRAFAPLYDVSCWIECTFDTTLERALVRGLEGLSREATIAAYRTIFPAQEIHIARDAPRAAATVEVVNDPKLG
jgi:uridine kinase